MTDFTAAWTTEAADFADRVAWRVVVMHVPAFAVIDFHGINKLCVTEWCQGHNVKSLGDATGENT